MTIFSARISKIKRQRCQYNLYLYILNDCLEYMNYRIEFDAVFSFFLLQLCLLLRSWQTLLFRDNLWIHNETIEVDRRHHRLIRLAHDLEEWLFLLRYLLQRKSKLDFYTNKFFNCKDLYTVYDVVIVQWSSLVVFYFFFVCDAAVVPIVQCLRVWEVFFFVFADAFQKGTKLVI